MKNDTSASGSVPAASSAATAAASDGVSIFCALNGGMLAESSDTRERKVAGHPHERAHAHDLAVVGAAHGGGNRNDLARAGGFAGRRQAIGLARGIGDPLADAADGAAQRGFHALRHGSEIGLAVERRENGAAHEGRAAQTGQNGAAEPLHGDAAAVDQAGGLAVDRQRRLVAEIDVLGLETISAASFALIQDRRPPPPASADGLRDTAEVPNATGTTALT